MDNKSVVIFKCGILSGLVDDSRKDVRELIGDLRPVIKRINIYENIFAQTITGDIEFQDNVNISSLIPLVGLEFFYIHFGVWDRNTNTFREYGTETKPLEFHIYSQAHRHPQRVGSQTFTLRLATKDLSGSIGIKISTKYKDMRVEDIIRSVLRDYVSSTTPFTDIEQTSTTTTIVAPYVTPLDMIRLCTLQGQNEKRESNYLFYETLDGYHFKSISKMIREGHTKPITFITQKLAGIDPTYTSSREYFADDLEVVSGYDMMFMSKYGYFASTTYGLDILSGVVTTETSRISDQKYKSRMLVNGTTGVPLYPDALGEFISPESKIFVVPSTSVSAANTTLTQQDPTIRNNFIAQTIDGRNGELVGLQTRTIRGVVPGAPELHAGTLVDVAFPNPLSMKSILPVSDIADGKYLVIATKHSLINNGIGDFLYETSFEACSDSIKGV